MAADLVWVDEKRDSDCAQQPWTHPQYHQANRKYVVQVSSTLSHTDVNHSAQGSFVACMSHTSNKFGPNCDASPSRRKSGSGRLNGGAMKSKYR
jgi:hypothetical protein